MKILMHFISEFFDYLFTKIYRFFQIIYPITRIILYTIKYCFYFYIGLWALYFTVITVMPPLFGHIILPIYNRYWNDAPIKFTRYFNDEDLRKAIEEKIKIGDDITKARKILEDSGVKCGFDRYDSSVLRCDNSNFPLLRYYYVALKIDKNMQVIELLSARTYYTGLWKSK